MSTIAGVLMFYIKLFKLVNYVIIVVSFLHNKIVLKCDVCRNIIENVDQVYMHMQNKLV